MNVPENTKKKGRPLLDYILIILLVLMAVWTLYLLFGDMLRAKWDEWNGGRVLKAYGPLAVVDG